MAPVNASQITEELWVGAYPQSPDDVMHLQAQGVGAVINLQSDEDFDARGIQWDLMWRFYVARKLHVERVPILDFRPEVLTERLEDAVARVDDAVTRFGCVYLHCTAGINRSPTVAIGWLIVHRGYSLDDAMALLRSKRPHVVPYPHALEDWLKARS